MVIIEGLLWSCGPQFASVNVVTTSFRIGKLMNELMELLSSDVKVMPFVFVPLMYLTTQIAVSMWPCDGLWVYFARRATGVAMSGRVEIASQLRLPTRYCIFLMSLFF